MDLTYIVYDIGTLCYDLHLIIIVKNSFLALKHEVINCCQCPRLVAWREEIAQTKTKRFSDQIYWGRPVAGFGDSNARLLIIGLAPAGHGSNRTGRMFTGDRSGDWLYRALHKAGFANQPTSVHSRDGLKLTDCYITACVRCAPPQNKPMPKEFRNCRNFLINDIQLLKNVEIVIGLGKLAFDHGVKALVEVYNLKLKNKPKFSHATVVKLSSKITLIGSYHPSQQNTFTRKLTEPMFDKIFQKTKTIIK